jgi:hypothetical protein
MRKIQLLVSYILLLIGLLLWPLAISAYRGARQIPTAPPPPKETNTKIPFPSPHTTHTPTVPSHAGGVSKTATYTHTPVSDETDTTSLTPTVTMTPTLTPTFTPTPFPNLHVVVYLDANRDSLFEFGEGVDNLMLLVSSGQWTVQATLQDGEIRLALPPDLTPGSDVQVQAPYLHWSDVLRAPKSGEILEVALRLDLPQFPVSLP